MSSLVDFITSPVPKIAFLTGGLDSVVDNALACHLCGPGSNPGQGMCLGSGRPSKVGSSVTFDHITLLYTSSTFMSFVWNRTYLEIT